MGTDLTSKNDSNFKKLSDEWMLESFHQKYQHRFSWLGFPILQLPQDIVAVQEIIWATQPRIIIETGVFKGGSIMLSASLLKLMGGDRLVIGVDRSIDPPLRSKIEQHPLSDSIVLIEGSSVEEKVKDKVREIVQKKRQEIQQGNFPIVVLLDSSHTHDHVLQELEFYSDFVTKGSYLVVFDTILEDAPKAFLKERPWGKGNSPRTALQAFLKENDRFEIEREIGEKLQITVSADGYLKCVK